MATDFEFRVVGIEAAFGCRFVNDNPTTLSDAEEYAEYFRGEGDRNVHIEQREVGPWKHVAPSETREEKS